MRKLIFAVLLAVLPLTGFAQQVRQNPAAGDASALFGITTDQALVLGVGTLGGAMGVYALLGGASLTLAGGVAGALLGDWWYVQRIAHPGHRRWGPALPYRAS